MSYTAMHHPYYHIPKGLRRFLMHRARRLVNPDLGPHTGFAFVSGPGVRCSHCHRRTQHHGDTLTIEFFKHWVFLCRDWRSCDFRAAVKSDTL